MPATSSGAGHVQDVGWQPWRADCGTAGTTGLGKRIEAVQTLLAPTAGGQFADPGGVAAVEGPPAASVSDEQADL